MTAGIIPGLLLTLFFILTIYICILIKPDIVSNVVRYEVSWKERISSLIIRLFILLGAIMVVTIPVLDVLNFDLIWFGVMIVLVMEIALRDERLRIEGSHQ